MNIEIMRNTLYKAYLDDFAKFCDKLGGSTAAVMGDLLSFEVCMHHCCWPCSVLHITTTLYSVSYTVVTLLVLCSPALQHAWPGV